MSYKPYYPDRDLPAAGTGQSGHADAGYARAGAGLPGGAGAAVAGSTGGALGQVAAGLRGGTGQREFRAGIEAGQRALGNRAFMQWLGTLGAGRQAGAGALRGGYGQALPAAGAPAPDRGPLQMMPKKRKQPGAAPGKAGAGPDEAVAPGSAAARPAASEPSPKTGPAAGGGAPGGEQKKKKKSRVQVALNTLRGEGVEAFGGYIEAEIGEAALLQTLMERITRAQDLGGVRARALARVDARLRLLDPLLAREAGPEEDAGVAGAVASAPEPEIPVIAQLKSEYSRREMEIIQACMKGNVGRLRCMLRYGNVDVNIAYKTGTLICHAIFWGNTEIVRELLSQPGIDVNLAGEYGITPLYLAAQEGHVEIVRLLLDKKGINVNLVTLTGTTPLFVAAHRGHVEVVRLLLGASGINVNLALRAEQASPLMAAVAEKQEEVVKLLLAAPGIDIDMQRDDGATALIWAAQHNLPGIVRQLVWWGADVNLTLGRETTPLYTAAFKGYLEVAGALLRAPGIRVNQATSDGSVPLGAAAQQGHKEIVRLLLRHGADPNAKNDTGLTSLSIACVQGHAAIVEMLLHAGADMDAEVKEPGGITHTPYNLAELAGELEIMSVLDAYRRRREAVRRREQLPVTAAPGGDPGTPALPGKEVAGDTDAATARVSPVPPTPSPPGEAAPETQPSTPLAQAKNALRLDVLGKILAARIYRREGSRLLEDVKDAGDLDSIYTLYDRLAHNERAWLREERRRGPLSTTGPAAPVFALGEKTGLDADTVEGEIKRYLDRAYHGFVGQAVNDMEFGRGKPTAGYPGLLHASAGVPGVGSCSVFYYLDAEQGRIRVVGAGHHLDTGACRLDYAGGELAGVERILRIA